MKQPTDMDQIFMIMAYAMTNKSRCVSRQVGAVITIDDRVIAAGVNNTPGNTTKCDEIFPPKSDPRFNRDEHHKFSEPNEVHAEMDALLSLAGRGGFDLGRATVYVTLKPCSNCLKHIAHVGIKRVVYAQEYDLDSYSDHMNRIIQQSGIQMVYKPVLNTDLVLRMGFDIDNANTIYTQIKQQLEKQK